MMRLLPQSFELLLNIPFDRNHPLLIQLSLFWDDQLPPSELWLDHLRGYGKELSVLLLVCIGHEPLHAVSTRGLRIDGLELL